MRLIDEVLDRAVNRRGIPCATAMVVAGENVLYSGGIGADVDSIFHVASMTKPITTVAALQLVERGQLSLDEPASRWLPELGELRVLEGLNPRPARTPVTLRHLLTHTSGFAYDTWSEPLFRYATATGTIGAPNISQPPAPLVFEPGTAWQYGTGNDWAGRLVEVAGGQSLENYFQRHIFHPLGMNDSSFFVPPNKQERKAPGCPPQSTATPTGGGGLYSTARDYMRFLLMVPAQGGAVLTPESVGLMCTNQIGELSAGKLRSLRPERSSHLDPHPGAEDKWSLCFRIDSETGRLGWGGLYNTYFWIDLKNRLAAVLLMQFLPFAHEAAIATLKDFETAVYSELTA